MLQVDSMRLLLLISVLSGASWADRPYRGGVVATAHPLASEAALLMLNQGGNAVDAAVAASFVLGVVTPYSCGIGGGGFALVHDAKAKTDAVLDFREKAPAGAKAGMYLNRDGKPNPALSTDGALSVAVPGAAAGYLELIAKYGRLTPVKVMAPAIKAAREGFWVSPRYQDNAQVRLSCLQSNAEASRIFLRPNLAGVPEVPATGTLLKQTDLAKTLVALSRSGASAFYRGATARAVSAAMGSSGGILNAADLDTYRTTWREPLRAHYRGYTLATVPPPSAGGLAVIQTLGLLEAVPVPSSFRSVNFLHRLIESWRRTYVDRARYLGDPAFVDIPLKKLMSPEHLAELSQSIQADRATPSESLLSSQPKAAVPAPTPGAETAEPGAKRNTSHISVIDREGNAVSLTTTINYYFGSCVVVPGTGILLNDEMDDFAAAPMAANAFGLVTGASNSIAPGKIPLSSMAPTLVFQKDHPSSVMMAVGSPGGSTIPTTVSQIIVDVVDFGMDLTRAVGLGRIHHQYLPDVVRVDRYGLEAATEDGLKALHHTLVHEDKWGDAEAVMVDPITGLHYAASDPRNEGVGLGQD